MGRFPNPPTLDDLRVAALTLQALGEGNSTLAFDALRGIAKQSRINLIPATATTPMGVWSVSEEEVYVAISGTLGLLQWALHVLGSQQVPATPLNARIGQYFLVSALQIALSIGPALLPYLANRRLVIFGHSFGGAIAQILLALWRGGATNGEICITYGCPRIGDMAFADIVRHDVVRIENTADPIVCLPPEVWVGQGSPWQFPSGLQLASYVHAGHAQTLSDDGTLADGEQHISLFDVWAQLKDADCPSHLIGEYVRRLSIAADWAGFGGDYADPQALDGVDQFLARNNGGLFVGGFNVGIVQGTMFFRTNEEAQGWSESWYGDVAVPNMLDTMEALAQKRVNFLAGTCEIHALRAAVVGIGDAKFSRTRRKAQPIKAKTSIKDAAPSGRTNLTMDAVDYLINSATVGAKKTAAFRGIPDEWIQGSKMTDTGVDGLAIIEKFLDAVKTANLGLRCYKRAGLPTKDCKAINFDVNLTGLCLVTLPGHAFPDQSVITLRGVKANPMLNGRWKISVVDANSFILRGSGKLFVNTKNDGTVQLYQTINDNINDVGFAGVSTRKTGRPFGARRGKRSAKLLHH